MNQNLIVSLRGVSRRAGGEVALWQRSAARGARTRRVGRIKVEDRLRAGPGRDFPRDETLLESAGSPGPSATARTRIPDQPARIGDRTGAHRSLFRLAVLPTESAGAFDFTCVASCGPGSGSYYAGWGGAGSSGAGAAGGLPFSLSGLMGIVRASPLSFRVTEPRDDFRKMSLRI